MSNTTPQEQLMLELINRGRMDPAGEAARFGIALNQGITGTQITSTPKQVLAGSDLLNLAADRHSTWMLNYDVFSHQEASRQPNSYYGVNPIDRMRAAGYAFSGSYAAGENISMLSSTGTVDLTKAVAAQYESLFRSPGHRQNMLNGDFREVGIGQISGVYTTSGVNYNTSMITQNFAKSGTGVFITGVVYNDTKVNDDFFSVGEQVTNVAVSSTGATTDPTGAGGGYELMFSGTGAKTVSFALSTGTVSVQTTLGSSNIKIDLVNGNEIWANASVTAVTTNIKELHALGIEAISLTGSSAAESLYGNKAGNVLNGMGGNDTLIGNGGNDTLIGGAGKDTMTGGAGDDRFVFNLMSDSAVGTNRDVIVDFQDSGADLIDLTSLYSGTLGYSGTATPGAYSVGVKASGTDVIVMVNLDADAAIEMEILLKGTKTSEMSKADFLL
ncbi:CAP domain-containing protein [Ancylobacter terrae]|uniref:CAP domain-containing protein n=1 Tax=Ancylobacter sp. sgz301288 TaxID=3342077 RepID=UPI00385EF57D